MRRVSLENLNTLPVLIIKVVQDSPPHLTAQAPQVLIPMPYLEIILAHPWRIKLTKP